MIEAGEIYWKLSRLAKELKKPEELLFQWAENGKLKISYKTSFRYAVGTPPILHRTYRSFKGYATIPPAVAGYFAHHEIISMSEFLDEKGNLIFPCIEQIAHRAGSQYMGAESYKKVYEVTKPVEVPRAHLVVLIEEVERLRVEYPELSGGIACEAQPKTKLDPREERTDLAIIYVLKEILLGDGRTKFSSQAQLIEEIENKFKGIKGLGKTTLDGRFSLANDAYSPTKKKEKSPQ